VHLQAFFAVALWALALPDQGPSENASRTQTRERGTGASPLDERYLDLQLLSQRGGGAEPQGTLRLRR
jgi:hypothetical protein